MRLSIGEAARQAGTSVRALRYYDEIGLLPPSEVNEAGYRYYDAKAMADLQQIVFYRELHLPLEQIGHILHDPENDRRETLRKHRRLLCLKRKQLDEMLALLDRTLEEDEMEENLQLSQMDWEEMKEEYAQEAAERWGNTEAFFESRDRHASYTEEEEKDIQKEMEDIFRAFGACSEPEGEEGKALARRWQEHICAYHYMCTDAIFRCLGEMYAADPRFVRNMERYGPGTAQKMHAAIAACLS